MSRATRAQAWCAGAPRVERRHTPLLDLKGARDKKGESG